MLLDEIKELRTLGRVFWIGQDVRYPEDAQPAGEVHQPDERFYQSLESVFLGATAYDCVPLADTLLAQWGNRQFRLVRDCFAPLPPYPQTAIELKGAGRRSLVLFESSEVTETPAVARYYLIGEALQRNGRPAPAIAKFLPDDAMGKPVALIDARWFVQVSVFLDLGSREYLLMDSFCAYFCDRRGQLVTSLIANPDLNHRLNTEPDKPYTKTLEAAMGICANHISYAAMILNLMGCKNVSSEPRPIESKLQKARARRGKPELTEYRVLTVTLPATAKRGREAQTILAHAGEPLPLQTIPGQYRDYRERGLFGKYKGIFYVPAHTRGSAEAGEVKSKAYRARAGKAPEVGR